MKEQAMVFLNSVSGSSDILFPIPDISIETFEVEVEEIKMDTVVVDDFSANVKRMQELREIKIREAADRLLADNPELKEKLDSGDYLSLGGYWLAWNNGWVLLDSSPQTFTAQMPEKKDEKKEEKGVQMIKKPIWKEIQTSVMVPIDSGNIAYQDYYPIHLDRFARPVDSLKEMEKITDAQEGDLVKVRSARKMYVCTEVKEVEEPKQKGWWIEVKLEGIDLFPWPSSLDYYFDLTPGSLVRCGDSFFDEDEKIVLDSIEERDRLDGVEDGQYVRVGGRLFMYIDDKEVEALVRKEKQMSKGEIRNAG